MKELKRVVVNVDPVDVSCIPWIRQWRGLDPLSSKRLLTVLVEVLFTTLTKQGFADALLQELRSTISLAMDTRHLVFLVIQICKKELWNDM